ncbi:MULTISPECIES: hypothetical protein [Sphingomonas]|jgi:hypothetical protein|uniref:Uncharacterized protein n=1 Tax=Sphingomonas aquatilis TaxID=93063 RepID=A0AAW3TXM3_9SPHN|nr:hypothetical protein [Sphingomonas aquatilis]MBB3877524.1 hypothetical protein [Sphingomonas aquatilis]GEM73126.1 hypothetical protein SAQ01S_28920 [Sphingomonas aquatilis NBRC 16722]
MNVDRPPLPANGQTIADMLNMGCFGNGPAFWRWIETQAAQPYIAACAALRAPPVAGEFFAIDFDAPDILDADALERLRHKIEAEHGSADPSPVEPGQR